MAKCKRIGLKHKEVEFLINILLKHGSQKPKQILIKAAIVAKLRIAASTKADKF